MAALLEGLDEETTILGLLGLLVIISKGGKGFFRVLELLRLLWSSNDHNPTNVPTSRLRDKMVEI